MPQEYMIVDQRTVRNGPFRSVSGRALMRGLFCGLLEMMDFCCIRFGIMRMPERGVYLRRWFGCQRSGGL